MIGRTEIKSVSFLVDCFLNGHEVGVIAVGSVLISDFKQSRSVASYNRIIFNVNQFAFFIKAERAVKFLIKDNFALFKVSFEPNGRIFFAGGLQCDDRLHTAAAVNVAGSKF